MEQLTIQIDLELKNEIRNKAHNERTSTREIVTKAIIQYLGIVGLATAKFEKNTHTCMKCDFTWQSVKKDPMVCPGCKSYRWKDAKAEVIRHIHTCAACRFSWSSTKENPSLCPECRSYAWQSDSPTAMHKKFCNMYGRLGMIVCELAPRMKMTQVYLDGLLNRKIPVTQWHIDRLSEVMLTDCIAKETAKGGTP